KPGLWSSVLTAYRTSRIGSFKEGTSVRALPPWTASGGKRLAALLRGLDDGKRLWRSDGGNGGASQLSQHRAITAGASEGSLLSAPSAKAPSSATACAPLTGCAAPPALSRRFSAKVPGHTAEPGRLVEFETPDLLARIVADRQDQLRIRG